MNDNATVSALLTGAVVTELPRILAVGQFKYDATAPLNQLTTVKLRSLLNSADVPYPSGDPETAKTLARYVLEQEFWERAEDRARAAKIHNQLRGFMALRNYKFLTELGENTMATANVITDLETITAAATDKKKKKPAATKKAAPKKPAATKKAAPKKPAATKKAAPKKPAATKKAAPKKPAASVGKEKQSASAAVSERRRSKYDEKSKIAKMFTENPYRPGSARSELLNLAAKSGNVGNFYAAAGSPTGGSPSAYLGIFIREGLISIGE